MHHYPEEREISGGQDLVEQGAAVERFAIRRLVDAGPGEGGGIRAEVRRCDGAMESGGETDEGAVNENEIKKVIDKC